MEEFWLGLTLLQKILFVIAVPATLILVIQFILLLFGMGGHGESDTDTDGDFAGDSGTDANFETDSGGPDGYDIHETGAAHSMDYDADHNLAHPVDHDHDQGEQVQDQGLRIFTVRGVLTFFTISGWAGFALSYSVLPEGLVILLSAAFGLLAMYLMALLIKAMLRLQYIPEVSLRTILGKSAQVYITIPKEGNGRGKIMVELGGRLAEVDAVSRSLYPLKTGEIVLVTDVVGQMVVVEKL